MQHWLPPGNVISTEGLTHGWLVDGSKTVPGGSQAHLKEIPPLGKEEKQGH